MRRLYFDLDGTFLLLDRGGAKSALAEGRLERAIRAARFDELVCVANVVTVVHAMRALDEGYDGLAVIFTLGQGVFRDEEWFRGITRLAGDPGRRALEIAQDSDWWYVDDLARESMHRAGLDEVFERENGHRILVPDPGGDGSDVLAWMRDVIATTGGDSP